MSSPNRFSLGFTWLNLKWNPLNTLMTVFSGPAGGRPAGFDWADMKSRQENPPPCFHYPSPMDTTPTPLRRS